MLVANWVTGHEAEHNFPLSAGTSQHSPLRVTLVLLSWDIMLLNAIFQGPAKSARISQDVTEHSIQVQGTTVLHALVAICANVTPAEKRAHQDLDTENTPVQLTPGSNSQGPVSSLLAQRFIYSSCGRKWGDKRGNTTLQLIDNRSLLFHSWLKAVSAIDLPAGSCLPLPKRLYPVQGTAVMTFALGSSNKPS